MPLPTAPLPTACHPAPLTLVRRPACLSCCSWGGLGGYFKVAMKGPADAPANGVCHWYDCTTGPPVYPSGL